MRYYRNHRLYADNPVTGAYLRWAYRKGIEDVSGIGFRPGFDDKDFSCLLCGVGNERTADEFIRFVTDRSPGVTIWIIDISEEQLKPVEMLVENKYPNVDIRIRRINALDLLSLIPQSGINWIETDAFLQFFDGTSVDRLLQVWRRLLKPEGFVTTRDYVDEGTWSSLAVYLLRKIIMEGWLGVRIFRRVRKDFDAIIERSRLRTVEHATFLPTYKRFLFTKDI